MEEPPPAKIAKSDDGSAKPLHFLAKKTVKGATTELEITDLAASATVSDLAARLAAGEGCDPAQVTLVCKGKVLGQKTVELGTLADNAGADGRIIVVFLIRKPAAPAESTPAAASSSAPAAAPAAASAAAPAAPAAPAASSGIAAAAPASVSTPAAVAAPAAATNGEVGRRVLLLIRHGQCCQEDSHNDNMKALTVHGQHQAEATARYVGQLFAAGKLPANRMLLHSTSRRARETAARLPVHLPNLEVWNADLLRETDPTNNPFRAEEVFARIFVAPEKGSVNDCLVVVAHNNINLYLLMRAAGIDIEKAAQAWRLFHLQHASITRIDVLSSGQMQVVSVGAAGHIPKDNVTWSNIAGPDLVEWSGGGPERRKLSGRALVLIRPVSNDADKGSKQRDVLAAHVKGLSEYMISGTATAVCSTSGVQTATAIGKLFKTKPQVFPDSTALEPEVVFLSYFTPPAGNKRDTVVMVAEDGCLLYCILRSLHMSPEEAQVAALSYRIGQASISIVQVKSDGSIRVACVGDTGHLPIDCI